MVFQVSSQESTFLEDLNRHLPPGIDWKQGALDYIAQKLAEEQGEIQRRFHLTKPFYSVDLGDRKINTQLFEFAREIYFFLNAISMLAIDADAKFLDVACGPGWTTHFLAKLNLDVTGIDISPDMIALSQERLASDPFPTIEGNPFKARLLVHDMEEAPIPSEQKFDVAILESALHHFVNPIQTLRNLRQNLSDLGVVVILESCSDGQGDASYVEVMNQYNTLERPYTRDQLTSILKFAGFHYQFLYPLNGFFPETAFAAETLAQRIIADKNWNIVVAAKSPQALAQLDLLRSENTIYQDGFYPREQEGQRAFRWAKSRAVMTFAPQQFQSYELKLSSSFPNLTQKVQDIRVSRDGQEIAHLQLQPNHESMPSQTVKLDNLEGGATIELMSDAVFSPTWYGSNDSRLLSFIVEVD
jgi:SAM-dependent methyltransferase